MDALTQGAVTELKANAEHLAQSLEEFAAYLESGNTALAAKEAVEIKVLWDNTFTIAETIGKASVPIMGAVVLFNLFGRGLVEDVLILGNPETNCLEKSFAAGDLLLTLLPAAKAATATEKVVLQVEGKTIIAKGTLGKGARITIVQQTAVASIDEGLFRKAIAALKKGKATVLARHMAERWLISKAKYSLQAHKLSVQFILKEKGELKNAVVKALGLSSAGEASISAVQSAVTDIVQKKLSNLPKYGGQVTYRRVEASQQGYILSVVLSMVKGTTVSAHLWLEDGLEELKLIGITVEPCSNERNDVGKVVCAGEVVFLSTDETKGFSTLNASTGHVVEQVHPYTWPFGFITCGPNYFLQDRKGNNPWWGSGLLLINGVGDTEKEIWQSSTEVLYGYTCTSAGDRVVFGTGDTQSPNVFLWRMNMDGSDQQKIIALNTLPGRPLLALQISPSGHYVSVGYDENQPPDTFRRILRVLSWDGKLLTALSGDVLRRPVWAGDESALYYHSHSDAYGHLSIHSPFYGDQIRAWNRHTGQTRVIASMGKQMSHQQRFALSNDSARIAYFAEQDGELRIIGVDGQNSMPVWPPMATDTVDASKYDIYHNRFDWCDNDAGIIVDAKTPVGPWRQGVSSSAFLFLPVDGRPPINISDNMQGRPTKWYLRSRGYSDWNLWHY
ncbi:MAG: hypothetical protein HYV03_05050 [Deltaproteobacteria bacterium]|nr:hypothetical protein [Deltaproteobacteria bacterium]